MRDTINEALIQLDITIENISTKYDDVINLAEEAIKLILRTFANIKSHVTRRGFRDVEEEIFFFKYQKPKIISKLIYFHSIYKIETKRPYGGEKVIKKYLCFELIKIKNYFDENLDFYRYYRTNSNYLDHIYFVRGKHDLKLCPDTFYFEADQTFSTSHDYKVAKIIANDLIQVYLEDQLNNNHRKTFDNSSLNWTASKTSLIELIYGLHSLAVFNNGNADIKLIAKTFESAFNIDLGDFYHTFMELKARKINRTKFLDSLCEALIKKMDEQDER